MNDSIIYRLSSLGCNFAIQDKNIIVDPEKTILEGLDYFIKDKKIFTMLVALLKYRISHLVNVKRLSNLSIHLESDKRLILRAVALKIARHTGDARYLELEKKLKKRGAKLLNCPEKYKDRFYINKKGIDKEFKQVGVIVADFFDEQPEKKLKTLKRIYSENFWLRLRAIAGPDYRADAIFLKKSGLANTQSEMSQWLQCNKSSISRIWASIRNIDDLVEVL